MGLARDLVELEVQLRGHPEVDLFSPIKGGALMSNPEAAAITARIMANPPAEAAVIVRLCLQALRIQYAELAPRLVDADFVATLPPGTPGIARPTDRVVREMVSRAVREIILLGYELTDLDLVALLADAASRGTAVVLICDRGRGWATRIREAWPSSVQPPRIFHDRERADVTPYASMHAKCLLVDGSDLLVTSANFTFHGLHGNIEFGVRLSGTPAVEARKIFGHLVDNRVLEEFN